MKKISLFLGLALACIAPAQITKAGNGYLFRAKYTKGAVFKYVVLSTIGGFKSANGQAMKVTLPMTWKILNVVNGVATVDTTVGPVTVGSGGQPMMQPTKNQIQIDSRGRVVGQAGSGQQVTPALPEKPVRVGQSWSAAAPIDLPVQGDHKVTATYTFKGLKTVNGKQMVNLAVKLSGQATGQGTMLLLMSDGSLFQSNIKMNLKMANPNGAAASYQVTANISRK
jgi:hypothetical protein